MANDTRPFDESAFLAYLRKETLLPEQTLRRVATASRETGTSVERAILELGLLDEETVYRALAAHLKRPYITLDMIDLGLLRTGRLQSDFMKRSLAIPAYEDAGAYLIACTDPDASDLLAGISYMLDVSVTAATASPTTIKAALDLALSDDGAQANAATNSDVERLQALANDGPVITLVNDIIGKAVGLGASDVHVEAQENGARVRYRIDGALQTDRIVSDVLRGAVASRLKIMASLNISEKRRPQDGRADIVVRGRNVDIRMSTIPTQYGESIVLRLLDRSRVQLDWDALRFPQDRVAQIEAMMANPNGIFLVAGPTGSGKTTTLYTALRGANSEDCKIVTVEDPIEYALAGVNQVQVDPAIEMSFATALRAILRQDPNVVMVGEIRDEETAAIAVRAALVGRLVLSTIHTNDAVSAIDRLLDLGIAPYLVGATLRGVLSQRLVRTICETCQGSGCDACNNSGQRGRLAVSEMLTITPDISAAVSEGVRGVALRKQARETGFETIADQSERLVLEGLVSRDEIYRAVGLE